MEAASSSASPTEELQSKEQEQEQQQQEEPQQNQVNECMYKTKTIQFLGRTTPIILQNENGPCPLLAICNILLLRNNLNLNADSSEVSQQRLLSLVAERLIDSNSNINDKDAGYVENQQQNIADAIDLLPRLATGIDVNIKFRRIDDFEFTRECAIFDLLDIPLYHGWIVDPQDVETADAIGNKSYNALTSELVALETQNSGVSRQNIVGEDSVDFVAATTATLGVPSPSLSRNRSFDDSPPAAVDHCKYGKGDQEEEAELLRAIKLSESEISTGNASPGTSTNEGPLLQNLGANKCSHDDRSVKHEGASEDSSSREIRGFEKPGSLTPVESNAVISDDSKPHCPEVNAKEVATTPLTSGAEMSSIIDHSSLEKSGQLPLKEVVLQESGKQDLQDDEAGPNAVAVENVSVKSAIIDENTQMPAKTLSLSNLEDISASSNHKNSLTSCQEDKKVVEQLVTEIHDAARNVSVDDKIQVLSPSMQSSDLDSNEKPNHLGSDRLITNVDGDEPIYEGEECILDVGTTVFEQGEPVYEGEAILAENTGNTTMGSSKTGASVILTAEEGEHIRNFLKNTASQLTFYGLFCLQEGLKERELCVFFRNNHFSTMFKYEGELYLLATDQGYLNQSDLVWEKLNEVNGDTLFMTGKFKEFKAESNTNGTWDEHNALSSTADYLASINGTSHASSDLQLAIALQQQEFGQQPARNNTSTPEVGASRLVTGPQVARNSVRNTTPTVRHEGKSKDKCTVM